MLQSEAGPGRPEINQARPDATLADRSAEREMQRVSEYDYVIVNHRDRLDQAVHDLKAIITTERLRVCPRIVTL